MAFWTSEAQLSTKDPKRSFRFRVQFDGLIVGPIVWFAKKVTKPNFTITDTTHSFLNHNFYYPGRVEWQEISMTLVDPVSVDAVRNTNVMIQNAGYRVPRTPEEYETMSKGKAKTAMGPVEIVQMDSNGNALETWKLKNSFIKSVQYGELAYEDDNLTEIELGLRYDWAVCVTNNQIDGEQTFFDTQA